MNPPVIFKSEAGKKAILEKYESVLAAWPAPYEMLTLPTRLGNTAVIAWGDPAAPPLVLLHGSSSNAVMWIGDAAGFGAHFRVFALDIPGEPGKSEPARPPLTGPDYTNWLREVLDGLHIQKTRLAGISLGGWLALKFATACPERVEKLVLLCPSGVALQRKSFLPKVVFFMLLGQWGRQRILRLLSGDTPIPPAAGQYSLLISRQFKPRMEVIPLFSDAELGRLGMPVLLLAGEKDNLLPSQQTAERLQRLLPHVTTTILPGAGHVLIGLTNEMSDFLVN